MPLQQVKRNETTGRLKDKAEEIAQLNNFITLLYPLPFRSILEYQIWEFQIEEEAEVSGCGCEAYHQSVAIHR
ncbi:hypothetical protein CUMW_053690 [Citrus unshiu]|nr:hypothetical protein CUMW_053690 [Citrus unshiu]